MAWTKKRDPAAPTPLAFHHPDRCLNCGHLKDEHELAVGCLVEGGTKYVEDEDGKAARLCSCEVFVPAAKEVA